MFNVATKCIAVCRLNETNDLGVGVCVYQVTDREMQDFSQSQLMDQGSMHNSGIDIPKRKDKEDLTESSEVCHTHTHTRLHSKCTQCIVAP